MRETNCCQRLGDTLRAEFQRDKFNLEYFEAKQFCVSQWQRGRRSIIWIIYRWLLAIFFSAGVIGSIVEQWSNGLWCIYLTNWGFTLCMYTCIYGAIVATIHYFNEDYFSFGSLALKIYWLSYWSTIILALIITLIFWSFLFPIIEISAAELYNIWAHGCNSVFMFLDFMLICFPVRLLHFIYPLILGLIYGLFSLIYYFAGGVDPSGNRFIYPILDWSKPGLAFATLCGCIFLIFIFTFLLFFIYKFRIWLHKKCCQKTVVLTNKPVQTA